MTLKEYYDNIQNYKVTIDEPVISIDATALGYNDCIDPLLLCEFLNIEAPTSFEAFTRIFTGALNIRDIEVLPVSDDTGRRTVIFLKPDEFTAKTIHNYAANYSSSSSSGIRSL